MKLRLLDYLACPSCAGDLQLGIAESDGDESMEGALRCERCQTAYRVRRGVPRFAENIGETDKRTANAFGYEWTNFAELGERYRQQFLDWIRPVTPEFFRNKAVLEGGCG